MTLIYASIAEYMPVLAVSDVLTSRPTNGDQSGIHIPTQIEPFNVESAGMVLAGVSQKMVTVGRRTVFLWSGSLATANLIIREAVNLSMNGEIVIDFPVFIDSLGLSHEELASCSVIYIYNGNEEIKQWGLNCIESAKSPSFHVYQGSGAWDFLEDTTIEHTRNNELYRDANFFSLIGRCMMNVVSEALVKSNYQYLYGGWMEILMSDRGDALEKVPYAIKFWLVDGDKVRLDLPLFFSWYKDHNLYISRMDIVNQSPHIQIHQVSDFMNRSPTNHDIPEINWSPRLVCHVRLTAGSDKVEILVRKDMREQFKLSIDGDKTKVEFDKELIDLIISGDEGSDIKFKAFKKSEDM